MPLVQVVRTELSLTLVDAEGTLSQNLLMDCNSLLDVLTLCIFRNVLVINPSVPVEWHCMVWHGVGRSQYCTPKINAFELATHHASK